LLNLSYHKNWKKKKKGNLDWHKDLGFFKQDFGYQQFVCFFFFHLWCKLQIVIYFNKSEVQKVELQSLVPLLVREETDKRRSKRRAFKINPPSKKLGMNKQLSSTLVLLCRFGIQSINLNSGVFTNQKNS
jgi:hypothetical protein